MAVKAEALSLQAMVPAVAVMAAKGAILLPVLKAAAEVADFSAMEVTPVMAEEAAVVFLLTAGLAMGMTEALLAVEAAEVRRRTNMRAKAVLVHVLCSTRRRRPNL